MAVTAQAGVFSFGPQSAKGVTASSWYKHRASQVDLAPISDDRLGPPEVGGIPTPTIPFRGGVMVAGGALINPRLESTIGWLLHGAMGSWTQETDKNVLGDTVTTMHSHSFVFSTTNASYVPWMSFRKYITGTEAADNFGEIYKDCKIVGLTLALPNDGLITARVDALGREVQFVEAPSWTYANTEYEDYESLPISVVTSGYIKIPGFSATDLPVVQATVTLQNAPLDVRQERVYGSPYLRDITIVGRSATVDMIVQWEDPDLYQKILTGSTTGTEWSPLPFTSDLDILAVSSRLMGGVSPDSPWQLRIEAEEVMYQVVGGIQLAANQAVMMRLQGTVIAPSSGDYLTFKLGNKVNGAGYTWPAADVTPPAHQSAEIGTEDDNTVVITFSEIVQLIGGTNWAAGFSVEVDSTPYTIVHGYQYATTKIALVLATTVTNGEVVTYSYDDATGKVFDMGNNALLDITDQAVTNNT